jgi:hypothetical protein
MKLTQKIKDKIDNWFNRRSPEEVYRVSKKYDCICEENIDGKQVGGWCSTHKTYWS